MCRTVRVVLLCDNVSTCSASSWSGNWLAAFALVCNRRTSFWGHTFCSSIYPARRVLNLTPFLQRWWQPGRLQFAATLLCLLLCCFSSPHLPHALHLCYLSFLLSLLLLSFFAGAATGTLQVAPGAAASPATTAAGTAQAAAAGPAVAAAAQWAAHSGTDHRARDRDPLRVCPGEAPARRDRARGRHRAAAAAMEGRGLEGRVATGVAAAAAGAAMGVRGVAVAPLGVGVGLAGRGVGARDGCLAWQTGRWLRAEGVC